MKTTISLAAAVAVSVSVAFAGCSSAPKTSTNSPSMAMKSSMSMERSLYERLGGEAATKAVVDDFVGRAATDPAINFTRKGTGMEWEASAANVAHLKTMLVEFIAMAAGGPQKYSGRSMKSAHHGMKISDTEFNALAADLKASLDVFKVPAREQGELLAAVEGTRKDIVGMR